DVRQSKSFIVSRDTKRDATPVRGARPTICVITAGHLSTCPRMLKVADALAVAGYRVRVVSARYIDWATRLDECLTAERSWEWTVVDHSRSTAPRMWLRSGVRLKLARLITRRLQTAHSPLPLVIRGWGRIHSELLTVALSESADLFYGGTGGGLSVAAIAGRRTGKPYALDLE